MTVQAAPRPRAGLVLGARYELTERIAVGGMGEVWQALDRRLGRTVAAKVLRPELAGDEVFLSRLRAEARNTAGLQHRNLAALLDHGEGAGTGYLVMELVRGETLATRLARQGRIAAEELIPILVQSCLGLHAAHTARVVHRDIKPANIMITPDGTVKVTDFGISLAANQAPMTSTGMVMGTAHYLAPEQATGRAATAAGDVYALGVLAFECLTGERPFTGTTQVEVAGAHINEPVPPLPTDVPASVATVIRRMLAKDPARRPGSARVCARELELARSRATPDASRPVTPDATERTASPPRAPASLGPATRAARPDSLPAPPLSPARETGASHSTAERLQPGGPGHSWTPRHAGETGTAPRPGTSERLLPARERPPVRAASPRRAAGRPGHAAPRGRRWRLPTWRELSADRVWLAAMAVVAVTLLVLAALLAAGLGTLGSAEDAAPDAGGPDIHRTDTDPEFPVPDEHREDDE